ncbi:hypothetical protein [Pseudomonas paeninsulae]|uniref:hypothetical protein n=1 Tax=Pseudomonas paeninsulae TaxID=3110772 RepID=UPI002D77BC0D|nr:hypothetical protein [Pseudomonas sp. IT1137]
MTRATELSAAIRARLEQISPENGYHTDLKAVLEFRPAKDSQPAPFALLRWVEDRTDSRRLRDALRSRDYIVRGVFSRTATLADLERFHYDVLRSLGWGGGVFDRPLPGDVLSDSAEIEEAEDGSGHRVITITLEARYAEPYA